MLIDEDGNKASIASMYAPFKTKILGTGATSQGVVNINSALYQNSILFALWNNRKSELALLNGKTERLLLLQLI